MNNLLQKLSIIIVKQNEYFQIDRRYATFVSYLDFTLQNQKIKKLYRYGIFPVNLFTLYHHAFIYLTTSIGLSCKTQEMYLLVFCIRYLDLFMYFISLYNTSMKIFFIGASAFTIYLMRYKKPYCTVSISKIH